MEKSHARPPHADCGQTELTRPMCEMSHAPHADYRHRDLSAGRRHDLPKFTLPTASPAADALHTLPDDLEIAIAGSGKLPGNGDVALAFLAARNKEDLLENVALDRPV